MNSILVISATYLEKYKVKIDFSDKTSKIIDFEIFFKKNPHPQWNRYTVISNFKKFKIENGNVVWGRDWDLIFPINSLYTGDIMEYC